MRWLTKDRISAWEVFGIIAFAALFEDGYLPAALIVAGVTIFVQAVYEKKETRDE